MKDRILRQKIEAGDEMPFFIVNANGIYPQEYYSYELAGADCEAEEFIFLAESMDRLAEILEDEICSQEG